MNYKNKYKKTLVACYIGSAAQAITANFLPLLFVRFHDFYGISYGRLAAIPAVFFFTQILTDLLCARFATVIGYRRGIIISAASCGIGLAGLAVFPELFYDPFVGIMICVIFYSVGSGLIEVLVSPIVEACPFENKDAVMSTLHSFYCWGSVGVILLSTVYFRFFGVENWKWLAVIWSILPFANIYNFAVCPIEKLAGDERATGIAGLLRKPAFLLAMLLMICAGASELTMSQWASAYAEAALKLPKEVGDLAGPCLFAVAMGLSRIIYGKFGKSIRLTHFMIASGILCICCYLLAALAESPVLGLAGCVICGFSVGIMWPGTISLTSSGLPDGGTAMFALLAMSGDTGGAVGPAIAGAVSQASGDNLQNGLLSGLVFPTILTVCVITVSINYSRAGKDKNITD